MFDLFGGGPPEDWEPIPDEVLAELAPLEEIDPPPAGMVPAAGHPDDFVWQAVGRSLGTETLPLLLATPLERLSGQGLSMVLRRAEELSAHLDAFKAQVTALIAGPTAVEDPGRAGGEFAAEEIGVASRCSSYAADARIRFARELTGRLTATAAALRDGRISAAQARYLAEQTHTLPVEVAREIEAGVLRFSWRQDLTAFKAAVRRWRSNKDPEFTKKAKTERAETVVSHDTGPHGTGELFIRGPLEITTQISMILTAYAAKTKTSLGGTAADRKLAGLRDLAETHLATPGAARQHGRLPVLNICIDLTTLLGLRDGIAEIPGIGAIPADAARWLLADGAPLRRLITDPDTGALLDYGRTTYIAPADLAEYLCAKNIYSAAPHSNIPATGADMEHRQPWDHGGHTNPLNVTPIDRRWHRAKTHGGWHYQKDPDGTITWTSPTGLTCTIEPHDYRTSL